MVASSASATIVRLFFYQMVTEFLITKFISVALNASFRWLRVPQPP